MFFFRQKRRLDVSGLTSSRDHEINARNLLGQPYIRSDSLYGDLPPEQHSHGNMHSHSLYSTVLSSKLGLPLPNPAPEVNYFNNNYIFIDLLLRNFENYF